MNIGLYTPGLQPAVRKRRSGEAWRRSDRASPTASEEISVENLKAVARAADQLCFSFLSCSQHVAIERDVAASVGGSWWDPVSTFGLLAGCTTRVRFATLVIVLSYLHPLQVVKTYATLDRVTDGRLILGVGVGEVAAEFELLGVPFEDRGARADDALRAIRAGFSSPTPEYDGTHYKFADVVVAPAPIQDHLTMWVGGRTPRSLRRAIALGDGWAPFGLAPPELERLLRQRWVQEALGARCETFDVVLTPRVLDPLGNPRAVQDELTLFQKIGATQLAVLLEHTSVQHFLEQMGALAQLCEDSGAFAG